MQPLLAVVDVKKMHDYRILDRDAMSSLSVAQGDLINLVRCYANGGRPPKLEELDALIWRFAEVLRCIEWADKFLIAHNQPTSKVTRYQALRHRLFQQLALSDWVPA